MCQARCAHRICVSRGTLRLAKRRRWNLAESNLIANGVRFRTAGEIERPPDGWFGGQRRNSHLRRRGGRAMYDNQGADEAQKRTNRRGHA